MATSNTAKAAANTKAQQEVPASATLPKQPKPEAVKKASQPSHAKPHAHKPVKSAKKPFKFDRAFRDKVLLTIFYIAWATFATYASQLVTAFPLAWFLGERANEPAWTLVYYVVSYSLALAMVIFLPREIIRRYRRNSQSQTKRSAADLDKLEKDLTSTPNSMGVSQWPTFVDIGLAPIGYVSYLVIAGVLTQAMSSAFSWFDMGQAQDVGFSYFVTDLNRIIAMIAIVFVAPVAEELVMRGWLYGKIRSKWGIVASVLLTSLIFAVLHGQWNVGVTVFALSIILCSLREITGTVWSGMLLHILSNGFAFYLLYVAV